jgi:hypothetical protein
MVILYIYLTCWHMKSVFYEHQQRLLSIKNSYDLPSTSTIVHDNWTCDRVRRGFKMVGDPLHLAYEDSALLWHAHVYIFASKHLNRV